MPAGMEKRRGWGRLVWGGVCLGACLCLGAALVGLEALRRKEMSDLDHRLLLLAAETRFLGETLAHLYNTTQTFLREAKERKEYGEQDDEYEYEEDSYEYEEEEDEGRTGEKRRTRRSLPLSSYRIKFMKGSKLQSLPDPMSVQAKIYLEMPHANLEEHSYTESYVDRPGMKTDGFKDGADCSFKAAQFYGHIDPRHHYYPHSRRYKGGSRFSHPEGLYRDWKASSWSNHDGDFKLNNSRVIVESPGLYYIYAQIYYKDTRDTFGFKIMRNNEVEFHCSITSMTPPDRDYERSGGHPEKGNTCYTGGLVMIRPGDEIWLKELEGERYVFHERTKSFFGLFRVAMK